jgi:hypothetical protein
VCRLVLLREILPEGLETEAEILTWLKLADALHREEEASHTCDNSVCGNPGHLEWAVHPKNIRDAWERRNRRAQEAGA